MSGVTGAKCCCDCWYRVIKCACEEELEQFSLFIVCQQLEDLFAFDPSLNNHLVFEFFDGTNVLCYDAKADATLRVTAVPPGGIVLDPIPPGVEGNLCSLCCPNACCGPCWRDPEQDGCCFCPGDKMIVLVTKPDSSVTTCCDNPEGECTVTCLGETFQASYTLLEDCSTWLKDEGELPCMHTAWCLTCFPGQYECCGPCIGVSVGWHNSQDELCTQTCFTTPPNCSCNDQTLDPCLGVPPPDPPPPISLPDTLDPCAPFFAVLTCYPKTVGCGDPHDVEWKYTIVHGQRVISGCHFEGNGFPDGTCINEECPHV